MPTATTQTPILNYEPGGGFSAASGSPAPRQGIFYYWPTITHLTGGMVETDLDAQNIYALQADTLIEVKIADRGASQWLRVVDGSTPVTDLNAGIITPTNYDAALRPYVLQRQLGF